MRDSLPNAMKSLPWNTKKYIVLTVAVFTIGSHCKVVFYPDMYLFMVYCNFIM